MTHGTRWVLFDRHESSAKTRRASVDPQLLTETVIGLLYVRLLLTNEPLYIDLPEQIVDLVLHGVEVP